MAITTAFTKLLGCRVPIQQAGMGAASTPELAAAVSNAGGLGMLTATSDDLSADIDATMRANSGRPFGVNFLMPFFDRALLDAVAPRVPLVEWYWSQPDPLLIDVAHDAGALAAWQVGSVDEARAAVDAGCDLIVAQGIEAGGHVRGTIGILPLLDAVLDAVDVPVVAAGGIGTARGLAAVLAAGASAARIGTRFVATLESGAHPSYQQALVVAEAADTVVTETYSVWWSDATQRTHRVLRSAVEAAEALDEEFVGDVSGDGEPFPFPGSHADRRTGPPAGASTRWRSTPASPLAGCGRSCPRPRSCASWPRAQKRSCVTALSNACAELRRMLDPSDDDPAFPKLDELQIARVRAFGTERATNAGDVLFSPADEAYDFVVVVEGEVEIVRGSGDSEVVIIRHGPGRFLGELNLLTGQRPMLTARVLTRGRVVCVNPDAFRTMMAAEGELSDFVLNAYIARRNVHRDGEAAGSVTIIGSRFSPETLHLRSFAARNRLPHRWVDLEKEPNPDVTLAGVGALSQDAPVVITPTRVLRSATPAELATHLGLAYRPGPTAPTTWSSSVPGRRAWPPASTGHRRVSTWSC